MTKSGCFGRRLPAGVAVTIAGLCLALVVFVGSAAGSAREGIGAYSGEGDWSTFPDSDLSIGFMITQTGRKLGIRLHGIQYKETSLSWVDGEKAAFLQLNSNLAQAGKGLSWKAVRIVGSQCNGHVFWQHVMHGAEVQKGTFSMSRRGQDNFFGFVLSPEDNGSFHCFQIKGDNRYIYASDIKPAFTSPPAISDVVQVGDALRFKLSGLHNQGPGLHLRAAKVDPSRDSSFYALPYRTAAIADGCNAAVMHNAEEMDLGDLRFFGNGQPIEMRLHLSAEYIGSVICIEVSYAHTDFRQTTYKLSPLIVDFQDAQDPMVSGAIAHLGENFNLQIAIWLLLDQLTPAGQDALSSVQIGLFHDDPLGENGNGTGGVFIPGLSGRPARIELNSDLFPDNYAELSDQDKLWVVKRAVDTLAHEFMHALDRGHFLGALFDCQGEDYGGIAWRDLPQNDEGVDWNRWVLDDDQAIRDYRQFWVGYNQCLASDEAYGPIYTHLKQQALNPGWSQRQEDLFFEERYRPLDIEGDWGHQIGSLDWLEEIYAEMPLMRFELPSALEVHYGRAFSDRRQFVEILFARDASWPMHGKGSVGPDAVWRSL